MQVFKLTSFEACNSYILTADNKTAVVIDCGESNEIGRASCRERVCEYV